MTPTLRALARLACAAALLAAGCAADLPGSRPAVPRALFAPAPIDRDADLRLYYASGAVVTGAAALARMQQDAHLIVWLGAEHAAAMDDVAGAFQARNPGVVIGAVTLPSAYLRDAIVSGGISYENVNYPGRPDIYASPDLGDLRQLKQAGLIGEYAIYLHVARADAGIAIGALYASARKPEPQRWLEFVRSEDGQALYEKHGFGSASDEERRLKPIP